MGEQQYTPAEWIEIHKREREAEGVSLAEQQMIQALAAVVIVDKLRRAVVVGATKSGRTMIEWTGEPTEAEQMWAAMEKKREPRIVKGGPLIGQEF